MITKEWENEPDKYQFTYRDHSCRIERHPDGGHLCGYVVISDEHVLFGYVRDRLGWIDVHGGITFAARLQSGEYLIGFDCAHWRDYRPKFEELAAKVMPNYYGMCSHGTYRNLEYVKREIKRMVDQIIEKVENAATENNEV